MGQLDPSIILGIQPPQIDPFRAIAAGQELRLRREQTEAFAEERRAIAEQRRAQTDKLQRDAQREAEGDAAYDELISTWGADPSKPLPTPVVARMYRGYGPERGSALVKGLLDMARPKDLTNAAALAQSVRTRLAGLASIKDPTRQKAAYEAVAQDYIRAGVVKPEEIESWTPTIVSELAQAMRANQAPIKVGNGDALAKERPDGSFETVYTPPAAARPRNFQSKDVLLDGRPSMVNFDTTTGRYFQGDRDVTDRVRPIPPQRDRSTDAAPKDDPSLPYGVQDYLAQLRSKHPNFGRAMAEFNQALPDLRRAHPHLNTAKAIKTLQQQYSRQYAPGGLDAIIADAMAGEDEAPESAAATPAPAGAPAAAGRPAAPAAPKPNAAGGSLEEQAARVLQQNGYDSSPESVRKFLSNPRNRQVLQGGSR